MAVRSAQVAVDDSPVVEVVASDPGGVKARLRNAGPNTVFIGDENVTPSTGYGLTTTEAPFEVCLYEGETVHGVCSSGQTAVVHVAKTEAL